MSSVRDLCYFVYASVRCGLTRAWQRSRHAR